MIEITLTIVIFGLLALLALTQYIDSRQREKLIKALIAKSLREVTDNEATAKINPNQEPNLPPDIIGLEDADESVFEKAIKAELKRAEEKGIDNGKHLSGHP